MGTIEKAKMPSEASFKSQNTLYLLRPEFRSAENQPSYEAREDSGDAPAGAANVPPPAETSAQKHRRLKATSYRKVAPSGDKIRNRTAAAATLPSAECAERRQRHTLQKIFPG